MEQLVVFIGSNPILSGAFAIVLAALVATESARWIRKWKELDTQAAILMMNRQDPLILDASNSADFAKGHILGAEHMAPSRLEAGNQQLMKAVDRPVLLYCKNGQISPQMATRLIKMGFSEVYVLKGGLLQWMADNQPISRGKPAGKKSNSKSNKKDSKNRSRKDNNASSDNVSAVTTAAADQSQSKPSASSASNSVEDRNNAGNAI